jgi:hypothetical protein
MKGVVTHLVALPMDVLFGKGPDVFLPGDPRFVPDSVFIANKTRRNLFSAFRTWFVRVSSPYKIAKLVRWELRLR